MSVFAKIKQFLGFGTIKVQLNVPPQAEKASRKVNGKVALTAASDQHVLSLTVALKEEWTTGRGDDKEEKEFELGKVTIKEAFDMRKGETRNFDFILPFELIKSDNDQLKEKGGALGMLGKAAAFASAEKSTYHLIAEADVKGAALDPDDKKEIQLV